MEIIDAKSLLKRRGKVFFHLTQVSSELTINCLMLNCKIFFPIAIARHKKDKEFLEYIGYCASFREIGDDDKPPQYEFIYGKKEEEDPVTKKMVEIVFISQVREVK